LAKKIAKYVRLSDDDELDMPDIYDEEDISDSLQNKQSTPAVNRWQELKSKDYATSKSKETSQKKNRHEHERVNNKTNYMKIDYFDMLDETDRIVNETTVADVTVVNQNVNDKEAEAEAETKSN
jgi:hypothetical protein